MGVLQPSNALPSLKDSYATVKDDQAYKRKTLQVGGASTEPWKYALICQLLCGLRGG